MRAREPDVEALRTRLARKFTTLADEVTECFESFPIGGGGYVVELLAPEGPRRPAAGNRRSSISGSGRAARAKRPPRSALPVSAQIA